MALYAISDLHLAFNVDKPMDIFGERWVNHDNKIKENWIDKISEEDTVLIAGDISWSMKWEDCKFDLDWISSLPGKKIISKGNHDFWWSTATKINAFFAQQKIDSIELLQNNAYKVEDKIICGTRGWFTDDSQQTKNIGNYIVDFYISSCRVVIEIDGSQHGMEKNKIADDKRDKELKSLGIMVLRYSNQDINQNFYDVCQDILLKIGLTKIESS